VEYGAVSNDATLVHAVRAGDIGAFQGLYQHHARAVENVIARHLHDRQLVADGVQEAFARALQRLATLHEPDRFRSWLLSIARNVAIDLRRLQGRTDFLSEDAAERLVARLPGPAEAAELADLASLVSGAVVGLSTRDAMALSLTTKLGFDTEDVAAAFDIRPGAARVLLHRARRRLRDAMRLQLLAKRPSSACADFRDLAGGDLAAAARHLAGCGSCCDAGDDAIARYRGFSPRSSRPAPGARTVCYSV
jgi:RNA polymerase sigma-70 factor (ECF subfamily)